MKVKPTPSQPTRSSTPTPKLRPVDRAGEQDFEVHQYLIIFLAVKSFPFIRNCSPMISDVVCAHSSFFCWFQNMLIYKGTHTDAHTHADTKRCAHRRTHTYTKRCRKVFGSTRQNSGYLNHLHPLLVIIVTTFRPVFPAAFIKCFVSCWRSYRLVGVDYFLG